MEKLFHLREHRTNIRTEVLAGYTTFLTMSYILFINPMILSETGMPISAVFVATVLASAVCSIAMGLVSNTPFAMAPGMGLNTFFAYTVCVHMGFHWKEALAATFLAGILHIVIMVTPLRKDLVNSMPSSLKYGISVGLGLFIAYIGMKNASILEFTSSPGQYIILESGTVISNANAIPGVVEVFTSTQLLAVISFGVMCSLLALEKKTGDNYAALPVGMLVATFVGIPLGITNLSGINLGVMSGIAELKHVFLSFFGRPGLLSLFDNPVKAMLAILLVSILLATNIIDSIGTLIGVGHLPSAELFSPDEMDLFAKRGLRSRMDKAMAVNSFGGLVSSCFGSSSSTTYLESLTGITSGGRTGLTSTIVGVLFLLCLPLVSFMGIVPTVAIAPALIISGCYMMTLVTRINWKSFEDFFPAFITIVSLPSVYGIVDGVAFGIISHIIIQVTLGKGRQVPILLYLIAIVYIMNTITMMILNR